MSDREPDLVIRASSFSEIFDCSERWAAKHLEGMWMPSGAPAVIGTGVHAGTATFDTQRMLGIEPSTDEAVEAAAESVRNPKDEVNWDDVRPGEAIDIATRLTLNYCLDISPKFTYRKVEAKLKAFNVTASNGIVISFTGHVDRQYVENDLYGTLDFKTGKQVVAADGTVKVSLSAAQLGTYELLDIMAAKTEDQKPLLPAMIVAMPTGGKQQPKVVKVDKPRLLLIGDENHKGLIDIAATYYKEGLFVGNPRSMLCNVKYCPKFKNCHWRLTGDQ